MKTVCAILPGKQVERFKIIKIIYKNTKISQKDLLKYCKLTVKNRYYKSVKGPAKVKRYIVEGKSNNYVIIPDTGRWIIKEKN